MKLWYPVLPVLVIAFLFSVGTPILYACDAPGKGVIKHVVIIFQENRTPDNLFQDPVLIRRGADIVKKGTNSLGQTIVLKPTSLTQNYDLSHEHDAFLSQYDKGKMDGADLVKTFCPPKAVSCPCSDYAIKHKISCPLQDPQFFYVDPVEAKPYFDMAETYTFGDAMFQNNQGPSFPAHQYIISGTATMGVNAPNADPNYFIAENPPNGLGAAINAGCASAASAMVELVDITNPDPVTGDHPLVYPCAEHPTMMDLLDNKKLTWKYYAPGAGSIWTAPNAIEHLCGPNAEPPNATACNSSNWTHNVVIPGTHILTDIGSGKLASVSWVIPSGQASDHAVSTDGTGPSWVASIVNAIGNSAYWKDTAVIVTWDDWGGWYDHVAPVMVKHNKFENGFRVPLIVISPYAKPAYISHVSHDFGSILKFVENTFSLPSLGYADFYADDLADCFDFTQKPLIYKNIPAPMTASYFLNNTASPTDPDDD
jgi:phospholipase C